MKEFSCQTSSKTSLDNHIEKNPFRFEQLFMGLNKNKLSSYGLSQINENTEDENNEFTNEKKKNSVDSSDTNMMNLTTLKQLQINNNYQRNKSLNISANPKAKKIGALKIDQLEIFECN